MTAEAINLIHQLSTPQAALRYLKDQACAIPDEAFAHFIDLHLERKSTLLRHCEAKDWFWLHHGLKQMADHWAVELPTDIVRHELTRIELEAKASKICALYLLAAIARDRHQQSN